MTNSVMQNINQVVDLESEAVREIERVAESLGMVETDDGWAAFPACDEEAVRFYAQLNKRGDSATGLFYCPHCGEGGNIGRLRKLLTGTSNTSGSGHPPMTYEPPPTRKSASTPTNNSGRFWVCVEAKVSV